MRRLIATTVEQATSPSKNYSAIPSLDHGEFLAGRRASEKGAETEFQGSASAPQLILPRVSKVANRGCDAYRILGTRWSWSLHALRYTDNMLWWRCVSPAVRLYRSNVNTALPRLVRSQSTAASAYEHILVSSPKPGVGLSEYANYDHSHVTHTCSHT